jgi:hypothetical protein
MHVMGVLTSGFEPPMVGTKWHTLNSRATWWPWALAILIGYLAVGAVVANLTSDAVIRFAYFATWLGGAFMIARWLNIQERRPRKAAK